MYVYSVLQRTHQLTSSVPAAAPAAEFPELGAEPSPEPSNDRLTGRAPANTSGKYQPPVRRGAGGAGGGNREPIDLIAAVEAVKEAGPSANVYRPPAARSGGRGGGGYGGGRDRYDSGGGRDRYDGGRDRGRW